jgi:hypothetical protein
MGSPGVDDRGYFWDLSSGGRINIHNAGPYVAMCLLSKLEADLDREDARLGIHYPEFGEEGAEDFEPQPRWRLVVGMTADGKQPHVIESKGGPYHEGDLGQSIIGFDTNHQPIWAGRGSTDYLSTLLATNPDLITLFHARPDIARGIQDGTITIRYSMVIAPGGNEPSTITDFIIDPDRLRLDHLGTGQLYY